MGFDESVTRFDQRWEGASTKRYSASAAAMLAAVAKRMRASFCQGLLQSCISKLTVEVPTVP